MIFFFIIMVQKEEIEAVEYQENRDLSKKEALMPSRPWKSNSVFKFLKTDSNESQTNESLRKIALSAK